MKLYVKNKLLSIKGKSDVTDESGAVPFFVTGKVIGSKKFITDSKGELIFKVKNKFFHWRLLSAYIIDKDNNRLVTIKQKPFLLGFNITTPDGEYDMRYDGPLKGLEVMKNGELACVIKRKIDIKGSFELTFEDEKDAALFVAMTIAIDNIVDKKFD